jgi:hypothetical protein
MTKQFLNDSSVEYEFVNVDLLEDDDREEARQAILSKGEIGRASCRERVCQYV